MCIPQALPSPITWVIPMRAPSTWRAPASPRQMRGHFVDVGDTGGAKGMPLGQQAAGHIDRGAPAKRHVAVVDQPARLALAAQPEVFIVQNLGGCEAVVQLNEIDVFRAKPAPSRRLWRRLRGCRY